MNITIRLGIVGYGTQGSAYAQFIREGRVPRMSVGAVCDLDPRALQQAQEENPAASAHPDLESLLNSGDVDAIITTVPHYLHPEMGIASIRAGIPVMLEKPAGVYTAQVEELNAVANAHPEVPFAIMFNQRANPLYQRLKQIVDSGEIGGIRRSTWIITTWWRPQGYYEQSPWRATWGGEGGGVLVNQAPHQLDLWQWICGAPRAVFAKAGFGFRRDITVEDEVTALVDYGDGATGTFITATHDLVGTDRLEILGDRGKIVVENSRLATITRLEHDEEELSRSMGMEDVKNLFMGELNPASFYTQEVEEFDSAWGQQHAEVLENFAQHLLHGAELLAPGTDGINGVRLANAIHLSAWTGREVPMNFDSSQYLTQLNERISAEGIYSIR